VATAEAAGPVATEFQYPSAPDLWDRLRGGELEIVYARDEGKGKIYITLKEISNGDIGRTSDPARIEHPDANDVRPE
jgi:hypothetical protein